MTTLNELLAKRQAVLKAKLQAGSAFYHPTAKGDASELNWIGVLEDFLPKRYQVSRGSFVIDSDANASSEIDIVIHDNHFHPKLFEEGTRKFIPAESVYAVVESKQELGPSEIEQAQEKAGEVRKMKVTSAEIPHAGGVFKNKEPHRILSGLLADRGHWTDPLGDHLKEAVEARQGEEELDLGYAMSAGAFHARYVEGFSLETEDEESGLIFFLTHLYAELLGLASVPALDIFAYNQKLTDPEEGQAAS